MLPQTGSRLKMSNQGKKRNLKVFDLISTLFSHISGDKRVQLAICNIKKWKFGGAESDIHR
jgi:hypothetical protein